MLGVIAATTVPVIVGVAAGEVTGWDPTALIGTAAAPGVLVVLAILFYVGKLHGPKEFARLEAENASLRADLATSRGDNSALRDKVTQDYFPALAHSTEALQTVAPLLTQLLAEVRFGDHGRRSGGA